MEYTIQKLARLAGISTRTLRYYHKLGLLKPARINSSGYRIYGQPQVDKLQQILFYRELGLGLDAIKSIITAPSFNELAALREHRAKLMGKREQIDLLIKNTEKTIAMLEGGKTMTDREKFEGFKQKMIADNEKKYGAEIRAKFGHQTIDQANQKVMGMTREQHETVTKLAAEINETLAAAFKTGDPAGQLAQKAAGLHRQWLSYYWPTYTGEAHAGVAQMYVDDERFTAYYDAGQPGRAQFLRDAIFIYTGRNK